CRTPDACHRGRSRLLYPAYEKPVPATGGPQGLAPHPLEGVAASVVTGGPAFFLGAEAPKGEDMDGHDWLAPLGPGQRVLLRRTAQRCLLSCLLALEQGCRAPRSRPDPMPELPRHYLHPRHPSYCDGARPAWQVALLPDLGEWLARRKR